MALSVAASTALTAHCQHSPSASSSPEASRPCADVTAVSVQSQVSVGSTLCRQLALCAARVALAVGGAVSRDQSDCARSAEHGRCNRPRAAAAEQSQISVRPGRRKSKRCWQILDDVSAWAKRSHPASRTRMQCWSALAAQTSGALPARVRIPSGELHGTSILNRPSHPVAKTAARSYLCRCRGWQGGLGCSSQLLGLTLSRGVLALHIRRRRAESSKCTSPLTTWDNLCMAAQLPALWRHV